MTTPPDDLVQVWIRDTAGDLKERINAAAKQDGRKVVDFLFRLIEPSLPESNSIYVDSSDRKIARNDRRSKRAS